MWKINFLLSSNNIESAVLGTWLLAVSKTGPVSDTTELIVQLFLFSTHSLPYLLEEF